MNQHIVRIVCPRNLTVGHILNHSPLLREFLTQEFHSGRVVIDHVNYDETVSSLPKDSVESSTTLVWVSNSDIIVSACDKLGFLAFRYDRLLGTPGVFPTRLIEALWWRIPVAA